MRRAMRGVMLPVALSGLPGLELAVAGPAAARGDVARGAYLSSSFGCGDSHTPLKTGPGGPMLDLSQGLSGHPQDGVLAPPACPRAGR